MVAPPKRGERENHRRNEAAGSAELPDRAAAMGSLREPWRAKANQDTDLADGFTRYWRGMGRYFGGQTSSQMPGRGSNTQGAGSEGAGAWGRSEPAAAGSTVLCAH